MSSEECQELNQTLSTTKVDDIPFNQKENVESYIENALLFQSVEKELLKPLETLLTDLQDSSDEK